LRLIPQQQQKPSSRVSIDMVLSCCPTLAGEKQPSGL